MKQFFYIIPLAFLCSCSLYAPDVYEEQRVSRQISKEVAGEYGLPLIGTGAEMMDRIKVICLTFQMMDNLTLEEARPLVIEITQKALFIINNDLKIRPYLDSSLSLFYFA